MLNEYELLDSGEGRKLERFGDVVLSRPCAQAVWPQARPAIWRRSDASFDPERGWRAHGGVELPPEWVVTINGISLLLRPTPAGHLGVFPETRALWDRITELPALHDGPSPDVLNLFAHSGGATLAAARAGASVCHVDASRPMVNRARDNAALNDLADAPIRWITEDVGKFLGREIRRGRSYDAIMLDPPSFGHGARGEQYRFDKDLSTTLEQCHALLSDRPTAFVLLTAHTQGVTAEQLEGLMGETLGTGVIESGVMELTGAADVRPVASGVWMRWSRS